LIDLPACLRFTWAECCICGCSLCLKFIGLCIMKTMERDFWDNHRARQDTHPVIGEPSTRSLSSCYHSGLLSQPSPASATPSPPPVSCVPKCRRRRTPTGCSTVRANNTADEALLCNAGPYRSIASAVDKRTWASLRTLWLCSRPFIHWHIGHVRSWSGNCPPSTSLLSAIPVSCCAVTWAAFTAFN